jgi:7-keto-8-aminopelargonate synthetase-like enzyme
LDQYPEAGETLLRRAVFLRDRLRGAGLNIMASQSQIIPILAGSNDAALRLAERLREHDLLAVAIRPPTVPIGTARLRLSVTLAHGEDDLAQAAERIVEAARVEGVL